MNIIARLSAVEVLVHKQQVDALAEEICEAWTLHKGSPPDAETVADIRERADNAVRDTAEWQAWLAVVKAPDLETAAELWLGSPLLEHYGRETLAAAMELLAPSIELFHDAQARRGPAAPGLQNLTDFGRSAGNTDIS